jgi:hypothetical protein
MAEEKNARRKYVLGGHAGHLVRFSYLHVFELKKNSQSGEMEYSTQIMIPKGSPDVQAIKGLVEELKKETWLDKGKRLPPKFWNPLRDGDTDCKQNGDPFGPEAKGHYLLSAKSYEDKQPTVVGTTRGNDGKLIGLRKGDIKSGDWGRISINLTAYTKGDSGVAAYINNVQLVQVGEALGNGSNADDDFGDFDDPQGDVDPLA